MLGDLTVLRSGSLDLLAVMIGAAALFGCTALARHGFALPRPRDEHIGAAALRSTLVLSAAATVQIVLAGH